MSDAHSFERKIDLQALNRIRNRSSSLYASLEAKGSQPFDQKKAELFECAVCILFKRLVQFFRS